MTEKRRNELLRKRNNELSKQIEVLTDKFKSDIEQLNAQNEQYQNYIASVDAIKQEFEKLVSDISDKQNTYDRLISQAKEMKSIAFNASYKVKIPIFTRVRLFWIMHKR